MLRAAREERQITYKGKAIRITAYSSTETLKAKGACNHVSHTLKTTVANPDFYTQQSHLSELKEK